MIKIARRLALIAAAILMISRAALAASIVPPHPPKNQVSPQPPRTMRLPWYGGLIVVRPIPGQWMAMDIPVRRASGKASGLSGPQTTLPPRTRSVTITRNPSTVHGRVMLIPRQWPGMGVTTHGSNGVLRLIHRPAKKISRGAARGHSHRAVSKRHVSTKPTHERVSPAVVTIQQADQNKTITVHVGQIVALDLKNDLAWTVENKVSPSLRPLGSLGAHARFEAISPGTAVIQAMGRPIARPGQMTAMFIVMFKITVRVIR